MNKYLEETIAELPLVVITEERKASLQTLVDYIQGKIKEGLPVQLNFICTHNSRRSQLAQVWAQTAADYHQIPAQCYSGGIEVTSCDDRTAMAFESAGFRLWGGSRRLNNNPIFVLKADTELDKTMEVFSKLHDDPVNPGENFAAIMVCAHADENCPYIPGAEKRISIPYEDPKLFDIEDSKNHEARKREREQYHGRSKEIGAEMFWVFARV